MSENRINWYPGHMAKARRQLEEQLKRADLILELCDARLPYSSRNPELIRMIRNKQHLLILNKADLADDQSTQQWLRFFRNNGVQAVALSSNRLQKSRMLSLISDATKDLVAKAAERGIRTTVKAVVIGVPNVGKSTLINALRGTAVAKTGDRPGVTKNNQWVRIHPYLELMDSPGLLWPRLDDQAAARRLCYIGTIRDEVVDLESLTMFLLDDLAKAAPQRLEERFHVHLSSDLRGVSLLDAVCRGRGWLLKGNECDYERASHVVPDEFRSGQMGKITLEYPDGEEP